MKKLFYFINAKLLFMLMLITVLLAACSEQDSKSNGDNGLNVSSYYPLDISPTALHERITVQFNRVSGIGAENSDACLPYYDVKIGLSDDINTAYDLGTVEPNDSLLIRFAVKKTESASDSTEGFPFFYYTELSDNTEYTIWIRSNFSANPYTKTLFGQAASVYRNNHYGGSGGTTYNGKWWGIPSSEVRYTIEYMAYSIDEFNERFNTNCSTVNKSTGIDSDTGALYDAVNDPKKCYLKICHYLQAG